MKFFRTKRGFTLIELMIVIAIIGILAAVAVPNFKKARQQARKQSCYSNVRVLQGAIEMYNMDNAPGMTTCDQGVLISKSYLRAACKCPELPTNTGCYTRKEANVDAPVKCTFSTTGNAHGGIDF